LIVFLRGRAEEDVEGKNSQSLRVAPIFLPKKQPKNGSKTQLTVAHVVCAVSAVVLAGPALLDFCLLVGDKAGSVDGIRQTFWDPSVLVHTTHSPVGARVLALALVGGRVLCLCVFGQGREVGGVTFFPEIPTGARARLDTLPEKTKNKSPRLTQTW
jgi:hypothetical protein